jgi:FkbM family methyltransferase
MWIAEETLRALDAPGRRGELARAATQAARDYFHCDIEIFHNGRMWVRRVDDVLFPDPDLFRAAEKQYSGWPTLALKFLRDAEDYWFHVYHPQPGEVIIDVGAGRGEDVYAFSKAVGATGRVWAFEAHPVNFEILDLFCELNHLDNVTRVPLAVIDRPGTLEIETTPVWESSFLREGPPSPTSHTVGGVRLDDYCDEYFIERIDFIKMNIEGAERLALPGMPRALARARFACISAHDFRARRGEGDSFLTRALVLDALHAAGFETLTRDDDPRYYVPDHVHGFRR